jgi:hypothetical protein
MIATARFLSRALIATAFVSLAGCAGDNNSADLAPAAPQQAEPAPAAPATAQRSTAQRSSPAGRNTQGAAPPAAPAPARQTAATPEEIKAQCWMKYEEDKKIKNIDQRLALVEKCIAETSSNQPPQRN